MELRADFIHSKNQVTNMDDVCKLFDFVVLRVFNFYVLFVLCVCFLCVDLVFKWFFIAAFVRIKTYDDDDDD